jgi:hypothetical protein
MSFSKSYNKRQQIVVAGKKIILTSLVAGVSSFNLAPSVATRLLNISDNFEFYRFIRLRFRQYPNASSTGTNPATQLVAYLPEETTIAFTFAGLQEQSYSTMIVTNGAQVGASSSTVPTNWIEVPRSVLLGTAVKWYKTSGATTEDDFVIQGKFLIASAGSTDASICTLEIEYICEFAGAEPASLQP